MFLSLCLINLYEKKKLNSFTLIQLEQTEDTKNCKQHRPFSLITQKLITYIQFLKFKLISVSVRAPRLISFLAFRLLRLKIICIIIYFVRGPTLAVDKKKITKEKRKHKRLARIRIKINSQERFFAFAFPKYIHRANMPLCVFNFEGVARRLRDNKLN